MAMTNYLENAVANATLRNTTYTSPANVYCGLYSVAPTSSTGGTELTGNGYARQLTTFSAPSGGVCSSNVEITFGAVTGNSWPTVVALGITDASTSGNLLYFTSVVPRNFRVGDSFTFPSGNITITLT